MSGRTQTLKPLTHHSGRSLRWYALRHGWREQPSLTTAGVLAVIVAAVFELIDLGGRWILWEDIAVPLAPLVAVAMVLRAIPQVDRENLPFLRAFAVALGLSAIGQGLRDIPDVMPATTISMGVASDVVYAAGSLLGIAALMQALYSRLEPDQRRVMLVDGLIIVLTALALVFTIWQTGASDRNTGDVTPMGSGLAGLAFLLIAALFFAGAASAVLLAFAIRVPPRLEGVWPVILGIGVVFFAWLGWMARFASGGADSIEVMDFAFPAGALLLGWGGQTWSLTPNRGRVYEYVANLVTEWLPIGAVAGVGGVAITTGPGGWSNATSLLAWSVVGAALIRQRLTRKREQTAKDRLRRELQERAATSVALVRIEAAESPEATANLICEEALRLAGIETATVYAFESQAVVPLAVHGLPETAIQVGQPVAWAHGDRVRNHADFGLWIERWQALAVSDDTARAITDAGVTVEAFVPLYWNEEPIGVIAVGSKSADGPECVTERLPALTEFGVVASAILGPMVTEWRQAREMRREIESIIAGEAFQAVFQPFVDLQEGGIVGYEALTRFDDGRRPDLRFADADRAGMSVDLETACLRRQLADSRKLPDGSWLSLNASPELVRQPEPLLQLLSTVDRDIVLEITEHVEISDYAVLLEALEGLRQRARIAVDDAGAGYAGLRHILELRPHFVKLDISVVRSVDTDGPRQAMVAGMVFFASKADCELIAEGIETEAELDTLRRFGVRYGQGYLLGKPARVA